MLHFREKEKKALKKKKLKLSGTLSFNLDEDGEEDSDEEIGMYNVQHFLGLVGKGNNYNSQVIVCMIRFYVRLVDKSLNVCRCDSVPTLFAIPTTLVVVSRDSWPLQDFCSRTVQAHLTSVRRPAASSFAREQ